MFSIKGIYPGILAIPDRYWPWIYSAAKQGKQLLDSNDYSVIYATYPHPSALIVGWILKRKTGIPLVVDFRDPWVEESMPWINRFIEGFLERNIILHADRVICNTPAMRKSFLKRYPNIADHKFVTITNGYDEKDFLNLTPKSIDKFEILYPGIIDTENRDPEPLLSAISICLSKGWLSHNDLQITFLGCGPYGHGKKFLDDLDRFHLTDLTEINEHRIPYGEALQRLAGADILVVLSEPLSQTKQSNALRQWTHMQVPAKVYEYLRLGRPIIALVSGGAVADILKKTKRGKTIAPGNVESIANALHELYTVKYNIVNEPAIPGCIRNYSRENLTAKLAEELNALI